MGGFPSAAQLNSSQVMGNFSANSIVGVYNHPATTNISSVATGVGTLMGSLPSISPGMTIDLLDAFVVSLYGAGGLLRAGVYTIINQNNPFFIPNGAPWANLLVDAGQVATDGSTGRKIFTLTPNLILPPNTWFTVAGVEFVSATGTRSVGGALGGWSPLGGANASSGVNAQAGAGIQMTGVGGPGMPLQIVPTTNAPINLDSGIGIHRLS